MPEFAQPLVSGNAPSKALSPATPGHRAAHVTPGTIKTIGPARPGHLPCDRLSQLLARSVRGRADRRLLLREVATTLGAHTPVWIWIDDFTRIRGHTTSDYRAGDNTYEVIQEEDSGAGVFSELRPYRIVRTRLDLRLEEGTPPSGGDKGPATDTKPAVESRGESDTPVVASFDVPEPRGLRVVVIGAGPTGLLAAIEAMRAGASSVTVYESRSEPYSRRNVPTLTKESLAKLKEIGVYDEIFVGAEGIWGLFYPPQGTIDSDDKGQAAIHVIEEVLARKASELGVQIRRGARLHGIEASETRRGSRPQSATLRLASTAAQVRSEEIGSSVRVWTETVVVESEDQADLVIVATGAGASRDAFLTQVLGITFQELTATDYGFYGLFERAATRPYELGFYSDWIGQLLSPPQPESIAHRKAAGSIVQTGFALTSFTTPLHDYILGFVSGLTQEDFNNLHVRRDDPADVKEQKRARLRKLAEHIALRQTGGLGRAFHTLLPDERAVEVFEIRIAQALQLASRRFPVVVVGDAAATPHPQTGSGLNTGIASLGAIGSLVGDLSTGADPDKAFSQYEATVGTITTIMVLKALFAMATAFEYKMRELFPSDRALKLWSMVFRRVYGADWEPWYKTRIELVKLICNKARLDEEAGQPDRRALDQAWALLDEVYGVIARAFQGTGVLEDKLQRADQAK